MFCSVVNTMFQKIKKPIKSPQNTSRRGRGRRKTRRRPTASSTGFIRDGRRHGTRRGAMRGNRRPPTESGAGQRSRGARGGVDESRVDRHGRVGATKKRQTAHTWLTEAVTRKRIPGSRGQDGVQKKKNSQKTRPLTLFLHPSISDTRCPRTACRIMTAPTMRTPRGTRPAHRADTPPPASAIAAAVARADACVPPASPPTM